MPSKLWKNIFELCDNVRDDMFKDISPTEQKSLLSLTPSHRKILIAVLELRELGVAPITLKDLADHVKLTPAPFRRWWKNWSPKNCSNALKT